MQGGKLQHRARPPGPLASAGHWGSRVCSCFSGPYLNVAYDFILLPRRRRHGAGPDPLGPILHRRPPAPLSIYAGLPHLPVEEGGRRGHGTPLPLAPAPLCARARAPRSPPCLPAATLPLGPPPSLLPGSVPAHPARGQAFALISSLAQAIASHFAIRTPPIDSAAFFFSRACRACSRLFPRPA